MIDIWNAVLDRLLERLSAEGISVKYSTEDNPYLRRNQFPHLSVVEGDDAAYTPTMTRNGEQHSTKMYNIGIYSNSESGRRAEAEKIFSVVDDEMRLMGFVRRSKVPVSNINNATIYRIAARYSGVVSKDGIIYRS